MFRGYEKSGLVALIIGVLFMWGMNNRYTCKDRVKGLERKIEVLEDEKASLYKELSFTSNKLYFIEEQQEDVIRLMYGTLVECSVCDSKEQVDVASVFLNRVQDQRFPPSLKEVLAQPGQVDAVRPYDMEKFVQVYKSALDAFALERNDLVGYYNPKTATDKAWVERMKDRVRIKHKYHHIHKI